MHLGDVLEGGSDLLCCHFWFQCAYQYLRFSKGTVLDWKIVTCVSLCMENSLLGSICIFSSLKVETMAWIFLGLQNDYVWLFAAAYWVAYSLSYVGSMCHLSQLLFTAKVEK